MQKGRVNSSKQNIVLKILSLCGCPEACNMTATMPVCFPVQISLGHLDAFLPGKKLWFPAWAQGLT